MIDKGQVRNLAFLFQRQSIFNMFFIFLILVGWSACHNVLKGREVTLGCSYRSTIYLQLVYIHFLYRCLSRVCIIWAKACCALPLPQRMKPMGPINPSPSPHPRHLPPKFTKEYWSDLRICNSREYTQGRTTKIGQGGKKYFVLRARKFPNPPGHDFCPLWAHFPSMGSDEPPRC